MDNFFTLDKGEIGKPYKIIRLLNSKKIKRRLLELGFINTNIEILKKSSLRGVYLLQLRNYVIALKLNEVKNILVENI